MKYLSLFSGIGAFEKALDRLGIEYELAGFSEIDKYAVKSYCAIHGVDESMNLGDITKIDEKTLPTDIDLITYGFPCQDINLAGKQKGLFNDDGTQTRSGLFFEALRIIEATKPRIAIAENVKNLTGKKFKEQFEIVLSSLEQAGYNNYWKVLNAKDYGIPQNRERVFIVSIREDFNNGLFEFPNKSLPVVSIEKYIEPKVAAEYDLNEHFRTQIKNTKFKVNRYIQETNDLLKGKCTDFKIMDYRYDEGLRIRKNNLCPTLTTRGKQSVSGVPIIYNNRKLRFITPKECWRLTGFDDEDFEKAEAVNSNTQLYKQAGNSIVVNVLEMLLKNVEPYLTTTTNHKETEDGE